MAVIVSWRRTHPPAECSPPQRKSGGCLIGQHIDRSPCQEAGPSQYCCVYESDRKLYVRLLKDQAGTDKPDNREIEAERCTDPDYFPSKCCHPIQQGLNTLSYSRRGTQGYIISFRHNFKVLPSGRKSTCWCTVIQRQDWLSEVNG